MAIDEDSGRHALGTRDQLNACLAGLLVAELVLDGAAAPGERKGAIVLTGELARGPLLSAAAEVIAEKGPKIKAVLSHMSRGLDQRLGLGTWDAVVDSLETAGVLSPAEGLLRSHQAVDGATRGAIIERLRVAAAGDQPLDPHTAVLLSMTGPASLLEVVAPERRGRKHARQRIDHALDPTQLKPIGEVVRRVLAEASAAVAAASTAAIAGAVASS